MRKKSPIGCQWASGHNHARILKPLGPCEECGVTRRYMVVHHKDEDWTNNRLSNLQRLCKRCHHKKHRTVDRICTMCDRPHHSKGLCSAHYQRLRKYGNPYVLIHPRRNPNGPKRCIICGRYVHAKGLCSIHYRRKRANREM